MFQQCCSCVYIDTHYNVDNCAFNMHFLSKIGSFLLSLKWPKEALSTQNKLAFYFNLETNFLGCTLNCNMSLGQ